MRSSQAQDLEKDLLTDLVSSVLKLWDPEGKAAKIENTGDTKGHEGPRYRQETIDANRRTGGFKRIEGCLMDGDSGMWEGGEEG